MNNSILDNMGKRHSNIDIMKNVHSMGKDDNNPLRANRSLKNIRKNLRKNGQIAPISPSPVRQIGSVEK